MEVRFLKENDYDTLSKWWKDWRWTPPPADMLPQNGIGGVMVYKGDTEICAGFVYFTNSKTAWIEFIVSNFQYKDKDRHEAIEMLINVLTKMVQDMGEYKYIYTSLKSKSLIDRYANCGYQLGSTNCNEMIKVL
jgi:hypothetical protein